MKTEREPELLPARGSVSDLQESYTDGASSDIIKRSLPGVGRGGINGDRCIVSGHFIT